MKQQLLLVGLALGVLSGCHKSQNTSDQNKDVSGNTNHSSSTSHYSSSTGYTGSSAAPNPNQGTYGQPSSSGKPYYPPSSTSSSSTATTGATTGAAATGAAATSSSGSLRAAPDADFLREASQGNLKEIELGKLAVRQANNEQVRNFGQQMINDHQRMSEEVLSLASAKGLTLQGQMTASDVQSDVSRLTGLKGDEFDREYIRQMVADHQKDSDDFAREAHSADDAQVRSLASKGLPIIQHHLQMAKDIQMQLSAPAITTPHYPSHNPSTNPNQPSTNPNTTPGTNPSTNPGNNPNTPEPNPSSPPSNPSSPENPR